ncbi:MAG TPA: phosphate ABC transporter permease PstA [Solirubrobacterales bacterium]|nr:phosphate ABC transporter permease PstA [Solirubrobacterales bacterium]
MSAGFDPTAPLTPSGNLKRRQLFSRFALVGATAAAVLAVAVLVLVIYAVASRGLSAISLDFIFKAAPDGIGPELVGTGVIVAIATLIAMPIGVLIAIFVTEYAGRRATNAVKLTLDLMNGLPSIIIALFIFGLLVETRGQSGFAAAVALSIIEVPLVARGSQEVLRLVPASQREAADALGVARWRSTMTIVLPAALGGIVTSTVLAVARAAGETAPLIFATSLGNTDRYSLNPFEPLPTVPVRIYELSEEANPAGFTEAWGLSLILISLILFASLGARALLARSKRKMTA